MKITLALLAVVGCLTSCATRVDGTKTFLGRDLGQWGTIGGNTLERAAPIAKEEFDATSGK